MPNAYDRKTARREDRREGRKETRKDERKMKRRSERSAGVDKSEMAEGTRPKTKGGGKPGRMARLLKAVHGKVKKGMDKRKATIADRKANAYK